VKRTALLLLLSAIGCSTSSSKPVAPPPAVALTPTPGIASRLNPNVIEETETYYIERLPKADYILVDDRHVRSPIVMAPIEFFKQDADYYYISVAKTLPEERAAARMSQPAAPRSAAPAAPAAKSTEAVPAVPLSDFSDLSPARVASPIRLEEVRDAGLPQKGMWRASFVVADMNADGIPDLVAPPPRMTDGRLRVWLNDGKGHFTEWPLSYTENGAPRQYFSIDYGGVAVADIDHDGHADIVCASHGAGLVSLFGDGRGGFTIVRAGLPGKEFSSQAVALVDARGNGKFVAVASRDIPPEQTPGKPADLTQVRVFDFLGRQKGWEFLKEGIVGGPFSHSLAAWDYDGDGRQDVLTGNHWAGQLRVLWKSNGDGTFSLVPIPVLEAQAFHLTAVPGTFGKGRSRAFADSYEMQTSVPEVTRAAGITVYTFQDGTWERHRLWRQKNPKASVYGLAMGDMDGDGLDDVVFADSERHRLRILLQRPDGSFEEIAEESEPALDSPGQWIRLADLNGDGRLDVIVSKTVTASNPNENGGWSVYLNRAK